MEKVIIRACDAYDKEKNVKIIKEGIEKLDLKEKVRGKIVVKPNVVFAHKKLPHQLSQDLKESIPS